MSYITASNTNTTNMQQPLPGQPPLPQMPPPAPAAVPPPPHMAFHPMASQMGQIPAWISAPTPSWQWITSQSPVPGAQPFVNADPSTSANYRNDPSRNNFSGRRDRYSHNRSNNYNLQRGSFHRKNRKQQQGRYDQASQGQFEHNAYFGASLGTASANLQQVNNSPTKRTQSSHDGSPSKKLGESTSEQKNASAVSTVVVKLSVIRVLEYLAVGCRLKLNGCLYAI